MQEEMVSGNRFIFLKQRPRYHFYYNERNFRTKNTLFMMVDCSGGRSTSAEKATAGNPAGGARR